MFNFFGFSLGETEIGTILSITCTCVIVRVVDECKTHIFLIHFAGMFLTILDLFVCPIIEYSLTFCFHELNENREKTSIKEEKRWKKQQFVSRHNFYMSRHKIQVG